MEIITSTKNSIVSKTLDIKEGKSSLLFLEGTKLVKEALLAKYEVEYFVVEQDYFTKALQSIPEILHSNYYLVSKSVMDKICDTKTPQGIVCVVNFRLDNQNYSGGNFIVLDNLQDPGNLGTIIRSACGTSFTNIMLINTVSPLSQKVVRSSMGGIFKVKFMNFGSSSEFIKYAKNNNMAYYSATMEGENIFNFISPRNKEPYGIVVGNEGNGVSDELKKSSQGLISIPMKNDLESLNAAVSASIIMYTLDNKV